MVRSPDGGTQLVNITTSLLQGNTCAPFLFIICLDFVPRKALDNDKHLGLTIEKRNNGRYP